MPVWGHIMNIQKSGGALNVPSRGGADQVCFLERSLCSNVTNGLKKDWFLSLLLSPLLPLKRFSFLEASQYKCPEPSVVLQPRDTPVT